MVPFGVQCSYVMKQKRRELLLPMSPYVFEKFSGPAEHTTAVPTSLPAPPRTSTPAYRQFAVPFMDLFDLPRVLPSRLTCLLPYALACQLRCVPVGRSSGGLTVAMADPTNADSVQYLQAVTGMVIFPVSCDEDDLNVFLAQRW